MYIYTHTHIPTADRSTSNWATFRVLASLFCGGEGRGARGKGAEGDVKDVGGSMGNAGDKKDERMKGMKEMKGKHNRRATIGDAQKHASSPAALSKNSHSPRPAEKARSPPPAADPNTPGTPPHSHCADRTSFDHTPQRGPRTSRACPFASFAETAGRTLSPCAPRAPPAGAARTP